MVLDDYVIDVYIKKTVGRNIFKRKNSPVTGGADIGGTVLNVNTDGTTSFFDES